MVRKPSVNNLFQKVQAGHLRWPLQTFHYYPAVSTPRVHTGVLAQLFEVTLWTGLAVGCVFPLDHHYRTFPQAFDKVSLPENMQLVKLPFLCFTSNWIAYRGVVALWAEHRCMLPSPVGWFERLFLVVSCKNKLGLSTMCFTQKFSPSIRATQPGFWKRSFSNSIRSWFLGKLLNRHCGCITYQGTTLTKAALTYVRSIIEPRLVTPYDFRPTSLRIQIQSAQHLFIFSKFSDGWNPFTFALMNPGRLVISIWFTNYGYIDRFVANRLRV